MNMRKILFFILLLAAVFDLNAQKLIKNGKFNKTVDEKVYQKIQQGDGWFIFDKTEGKTKITQVDDDESHEKVMKIETTNDDVWYKSYLAQNIKGAEKGQYTVSFEAKAITPGAQVRVYLRCVDNDKLFFLRNGFDVTDESLKNQSAAAFTKKLNKTNEWTKVSVDFDLSNVVNNIYSNESLEKKGKKIKVMDSTEGMLGNFILVIQLQNKNAKVLIDNVSMKKK